MAQHDDREQATLEKDQKTLDALVQADIDDAVRDCLTTRRGRRFLWWLLQQGRVGEQPFRADSLVTAFNCGELNVGQKMLDRIVAVDPAGYVNMQVEQLNEDAKRRTVVADAGEDDGGPAE